MKKEVKQYIDQAVEDKIRTIHNRPIELSLRELAHICDIPMSTLSYYRRSRGLPVVEYLRGKAGKEIKVDLKAFRTWCGEKLKGKKKADIIARVDQYTSIRNRDEK